MPKRLLGRFENFASEQKKETCLHPSRFLYIAGSYFLSLKSRDAFDNDLFKFGYIWIVRFRTEALLHLFQCRAKGFLYFGCWTQTHVLSDVLICC